MRMKIAIVNYVIKFSTYPNVQHTLRIAEIEIRHAGQKFPRYLKPFPIKNGIVRRHERFDLVLILQLVYPLHC